MSRRPGLGLFGSKDRYIEELLANQEKELEELRKEPEEREREAARRQYQSRDKWSKKETGTIMRSAILAGLLIGVIFLGGMFLFLLFCINVWFV